MSRRCWRSSWLTQVGTKKGLIEVGVPEFRRRVTEGMATPTLVQGLGIDAAALLA